MQQPSAAGCSCPERPSAEARGGAGWRAQHERLVQDATTANKLDVVFVGDSITERWNGTKGLGTKKIPGGREAFDKFFTRQGGANMDGIPLGSAGDQVRRPTLAMSCSIVPLFPTHARFVCVSFFLYCRPPIFYGISRMACCPIRCVPKFGWC